MSFTTFETTRAMRVLRGPGAMGGIGAELDRLGAARAFVLTGRSVATRTPLLERLKAGLGARFAGVHPEIGAHTPMPELVAAMAAARVAGADAVISLGGGSVVDAGKIASACLALGIADAQGLRDYLAAQDGRPIPDMPVQVAVPTTASAAEFTKGAGVLDPEAVHKRSLRNPAIVPDVVVMDPEVVTHTPPFLWLSSAIRSVDHAVEALGGAQANAYTDALAEGALRLLFAALPRCHADHGDIAAIRDVQQATWLAGNACTGAQTGLSHGIGYLLGANFGVPHGVCSCITLPHVMAWNGTAGGKADAVLRRVSGLDGPGHGAVDALIRGLDLPRRVRDAVEVTEDQVTGLSAKAMALPHVPINPRVPQDEAELTALMAQMY